MVNYIYDIDTKGIIGDYDNIDKNFITNLTEALKLNADSIKNLSLLTFYKLKSAGAKRMFGKTYNKFTKDFIEDFWIETNNTVYYVYKETKEQRNNLIIDKSQFYKHFQINQNKVIQISDEENIRSTYHIFQTFFQVMKLKGKNPIAEKIQI